MCARVRDRDVNLLPKHSWPHRGRIRTDDSQRFSSISTSFVTTSASTLRLLVSLRRRRPDGVHKKAGTCYIISACRSKLFSGCEIKKNPFNRFEVPSPQAFLYELLIYVASESGVLLCVRSPQNIARLSIRKVFPKSSLRFGL